MMQQTPRAANSKDNVVLVDELDVFTLGGVRGGAFIGATAALAAVMSLLGQVILERALGPPAFAQWSVLNSVLVIVVPIACMGCNHLLLSRHLDSEFRSSSGMSIFGWYFAIFAVAAAVVMAALLLSARASLSVPGSLAWLILIFVAQIPTNLAFPLFQRGSKVLWVALWPTAQIGIRVAVAIVALALSLGVGGVMAAWAIGSVGLAVVAVAQIRRFVRAELGVSRERDASVPAGPATLRSLLTIGLGFGLSDLAESLDIKLIVPVASWIFSPFAASTAAAGLVFVLLSAAQFFPYILVTRVLLPAIHRGASGAEAQISRFVVRLSGAALLVLVPLTITFHFFGYRLVQAVVRGDYSSEARAIAWLGAAWLPLCISQLAIAPHMGRDSTWRLFRWRVEALVVFLLLATLSRSFGLLGLVWCFAAGRTWLCVRAFWNLDTLR